MNETAMIEELARSILPLREMYSADYYIASENKPSDMYSIENSSINIFVYLEGMYYRKDNNNDI